MFKAGVIDWLFPPEGASEEHEHAEDFESSQNHGDNADPGLYIGQNGIITGSAGGPKCRTQIVDTSDDRAECRDEIEPGQQHLESQYGNRLEV